MSLGAPDPHRDSLIVSDQPWNADPALLGSASRIVLCSDSEAETIETLTELKKFFPVTCPLHARLSLPFDDVRRFGSVEELFSPELVLRAGLNDTAIRLNEIYRSSVQGNAPAWEGLSSFTRRSNIASAEYHRMCSMLFPDRLAEPDDELAELEHIRWCRFHYLYHWRTGAGADGKKDPAARLHPCLVPYDRLSRQDQQKDMDSIRILNQVMERT